MCVYCRATFGASDVNSKQWRFGSGLAEFIAHVGNLLNSLKDNMNDLNEQNLVTVAVAGQVFDLLQNIQSH